MDNTGRLDSVSLSRIEIEWLAACVYGASTRMPHEVFHRLRSAGLIEGMAVPKITTAGRSWLQAGGHVPPQGPSRRA